MPRLEANEFDDITVRATGSCAGRAQIRAELSYTGSDTGPDPVTSNDRAHHTIEVSEPAFAITFNPEAPAGPFTEDLAVAVTIRAVVGGSIPAGAVASFSPPLGMELASVSLPGSGCSTLGPLIECTLPEVASGGSAVAAVTLRASNGPATGPLLVDVRSASGAANESESVSVRLRGPDLAVAATTAPSFPVVRDRSEWAFTVQNIGAAREDKGGFSVIVPVGAFEAISIDGVVGCREVPTGFVCPLPDAARAPGGSAVVTFAGRPRLTGDVTVRATARAEYTPDETATNDSDAFTTRIRGADFVPSVGFFPDSANPGEDVELRYVVTNSGSADGRVTTGSVGLGGRLTVVSAPPGCTVSQGVASCVVPELTIGAMATFSFTVRPSGTGDITVVGEVAADDDENAGNNRQSGRLIMVAVDSDGDGTPDSVEDAGPGGGDANGDSVPDRTQPHVASIPVAGHGSLVVEAPSGTTLRQFGLTTPPAAPPAGVTFPMGALTFEVAGVTPGGLVPIRLTFPAGVPAWAYYKYSGGAWSRLDWDGTTGGRPLDARTLELVLRDGGRGDEDGSADGVVRDPGAPGLIGFAVDDAGDGGDAVPGDGLCETAGGSCTLRAALEETNAGGEARVVSFAFAEAVVISPSTPLPPVTVPVVLDGSGVPYGDFGAKGVTLSGLGLDPGPLLTIAAPGTSLVGIGLEDNRGDGVVVRASGVRFAGCSLGAPRSRLVDHFEWATVRADDGDTPAHELALVDSWLGAIHGSALYGAVIEGAEDVLVDGLVLGSNRIDGLRPQDELLNGLVLRDTPRARLRGISASGLQDVLRLEGALDGTVVEGGTFGLGTDGFCHAFTHDDPGPAETGTGPCLDGNQRAIVLVGASGVDIGGADEVGGNLFGNNVEAVVLDAGSHDNVVRNNRIGLAADGSCQPAFSDGLCRLLVSNGVLVRDSHDNLVGGSGDGNIVGAANLYVYGAGSEDNVIEGNWIGFQTDRVTPVHPGFITSTPFPLEVAIGATGTQILDNTVGSVRVVDPATTGTVVRGNRIGLDTTGTHEAVGASYTGGAGTSRGIVLSFAGQTTVAQNTIASYFDYCVGIEASDDVTIADNHIGVTRDGTALTSCILGPVLVTDSRNTVVEGNTVGRCVDEASASFASACIFVSEEAEGTVIDGNTIGALLDGPGGALVEPITSFNPAIVLEAAPSTVIANNRIFGTTFGIYDRGAFFGVENATRIVGNDIGVRDDAPWGGTSDHGMLLVSAGASVGGLGAGSPNRVMGSGGAGIRVGTVQPIVVRENVLAENAGLGIAFNNGGSPESNDADDSDGGPNGRQNHPFVTAYADTGSPTASVSLISAASTTYQIDVYAVSVVDPSGYGEADEWLGTASLTTGVDHTGTAVVALTRPLLPGEVLSATATGPDGTSELGPAVRPTTAGLANLSVSVNPAEGSPVGVPMPVVLGLFNNGPDTAVGTVITATVPEGWTWGTPSDVEAGTCSVEGRTVQCVGFDLAPFAGWSAQVPATPSAVGRFLFEVRAHSEVSDPVLDDNYRATEVAVGTVEYVLTTSAVGGGLRNTGVPIPVNVTHFWLGARADLDDLVLSIALPAGARVSGGELSCQTTGPIGGRTASCDFGPVSRLDASTVRSVELTFDTAYPSGLFVDFTLAGANPNLSRAVAQLGLTVLGGAVGSLSLDANATPEGPLAGAPVELSVAITNGTATIVDDGVLSLRLPAGSALLRTDGTCAVVDGEVICLLSPLSAATSDTVTLALTAPAASAEVEACLTRADDADAEPLCDAVTIAPGAVDVAIAVAPAIVDVLSGERMRLEATVSTATGAGASEVVWTTDGDANAEGAGCVADGASWRCNVPALGTGGSARVALDLDPAAGELQSWVATVVAAGDAVPANDSAVATVYASTVADCGGRDADVLFDSGAGDAPTAAGFAASGPGAVSTAAWVLGGDSGTITTPPLALGDDAVALRVAWLQRGDAAGLGASGVEVSADGGATWSVVSGDAAGDELGEGWRERVVSLGAPGAAPLAVRWRAEGGGSGAWALDALRVVVCRADDDADLALTPDAEGSSPWAPSPRCGGGPLEVRVSQHGPMSLLPILLTVGALVVSCRTTNVCELSADEWLQEPFREGTLGYFLDASFTDMLQYCQASADVMGTRCDSSPSLPTRLRQELERELDDEVYAYHEVGIGTLFRWAYEDERLFLEPEQRSYDLRGVLDDIPADLVVGVDFVDHFSSCSHFLDAAVEAGVDVSVATLSSNLNANSREATEFLVVRGTFENPLASILAANTDYPNRRRLAHLELYRHYLDNPAQAGAELFYVVRATGVAAYRGSSSERNFSAALTASANASFWVGDIGSSLDFGFDRVQETTVQDWAFYLFYRPLADFQLDPTGPDADASPLPEIRAERALLPTPAQIAGVVREATLSPTAEQLPLLAEGAPFPHSATVVGVPAPMCRQDQWELHVDDDLPGRLDNLDANPVEVDGVPACRFSAVFRPADSVFERDQVGTPFQLAYAIRAKEAPFGEENRLAFSVNGEVNRTRDLEPRALAFDPLPAIESRVVGQSARWEVGIALDDEVGRVSSTRDAEVEVLNPSPSCSPLPNLTPTFGPTRFSEGFAELEISMALGRPEAIASVDPYGEECRLNLRLTLPMESGQRVIRNLSFTIIMPRVVPTPPPARDQALPSATP